MSLPTLPHPYLTTGILSISAGLHAGASVAAASAAAVQTPVAVLFGSSYFVVSHLVSYGWGQLEQWSKYPFETQATEAKVFKLALSLFTGLAAAVWVTSFLHGSITIIGAGILSCAMVGTTAGLGLLMCGVKYARPYAIGPNVV